jgi:hypothetical protein
VNSRGFHGSRLQHTLGSLCQADVS